MGRQNATNALYPNNRITLTDASSISTDASLGSYFSVTLTGNRTLANPTNGSEFQIATWEFRQDTTGSRTITLGQAFRLGTDVSSVTLSTTPGARDLMTAVYNAANDVWYVTRFVKGYSPAPYFVAIGTEAAGTGAVSPGIPSGTRENDILILFAEAGGSEQATAPSGYTDMSVPGGNGASNLSVFWKRAGSSESAPTVADSGARTRAVIMAVRGCVTSGSPWDDSQSSNSGGGSGTTSLSVSQITSTKDETLCVYAITANSATTGAGFSAWANANLANVTERIDTIDTAVAGHIGVATGVKLVAGATGSTTVTFINTSSFGGQFSGALKAY